MNYYPGAVGLRGCSWPRPVSTYEVAAEIALQPDSTGFNLAVVATLRGADDGFMIVVALTTRIMNYTSQVSLGLASVTGRAFHGLLRVIRLIGPNGLHINVQDQSLGQMRYRSL